MHAFLFFILGGLAFLFVAIAVVVCHKPTPTEPKRSWGFAWQMFAYALLSFLFAFGAMLLAA